MCHLRCLRPCSYVCICCRVVLSQLYKNRGTDKRYTMSPWKTCKIRNIIGAFGTAILLEGTFYLLRKFWQKYFRKNCEQINQILFFPDSKPACKASYTQRHGCTNTSCRYAHEDTSFGTLMKFIYSARASVDLCIFCITSPDMCDALIDLNNHGVIVRVIADEGQLDSEGSKVGRFRAEGEKGHD